MNKKEFVEKWKNQYGSYPSIAEYLMRKRLFGDVE